MELRHRQSLHLERVRTDEPLSTRIVLTRSLRDIGNLRIPVFVLDRRCVAYDIEGQSQTSEVSFECKAGSVRVDTGQSSSSKSTDRSDIFSRGNWIEADGKMEPLNMVTARNTPEIPSLVAETVDSKVLGGRSDGSRLSACPAISVRQRSKASIPPSVSKGHTSPTERSKNFCQTFARATGLRPLIAALPTLRIRYDGAAFVQSYMTHLR
jgi:hypothetical protein